MKRLPAFLERYFWDAEFGKINLDDRRAYVLKRILEYGDEKAVGWMLRNFKERQIKDALCNFRGYSLKTANFWALILNIKKEKVKCLSRPFRETQKLFWPH